MSNLITIHGLIVAIGLLVYVVTAHLLGQRRHPTAAIAWVLFIVLLPYAAVPLFLAFGSRKLLRPHAPGIAPAAAGDSSWVLRTTRALGQPEPAAYEHLAIDGDGAAALHSLWRIIDGATKSIDLCTFILGRGRLGQAVVERLCAKQRAGVRVRLLLDGMGSLMAGRPDLQPLHDAGVSVCLFVPPLRSPLKGRTNLRNHRKMLIVDAGTAHAALWCGGRNLASEYFDGEPGRAAWRDLSFSLSGALVAQCTALFEHDWNFASTQRRGFVASDAAPPADRALSAAQLVASGPDQVDDTVYALLLSAAYQARRRILLVTPYFVPDAALLMALCLAARRGVAVHLLLPGKSNHRLSDIARGRALRSLAEAGAQVWLAPQMLHAKLAVIDDDLALAGSANLDGRSLFLNYELMMAFHAGVDVRRFADWFDAERATAAAFIARPPGLARDLLEGMVLWIGFQL